MHQPARAFGVPPRALAQYRPWNVGHTREWARVPPLLRVLGCLPLKDGATRSAGVREASGEESAGRTMCDRAVGYGDLEAAGGVARRERRDRRQGPQRGIPVSEQARAIVEVRLERTSVGTRTRWWSSAERRRGRRIGGGKGERHSGAQPFVIMSYRSGWRPLDDIAGRTRARRSR
jgi:hypothetical protein